MDGTLQLCILRLSAIGDVCHAAAAVNRILSLRPHTKITWIIGKIEYQLLKGMPNVEFIVYDKKGGKTALNEVVTALDDRVFDALFVMQVALRANLLSRKIKAKRRIGFDWSRSKEGHWLFTNERIEARQHAHVLEGFMGFADKFLASTVDQQFDSSTHKPTWPVLTSLEDRQWAAQQISSLNQYVVISPAASKAERNWHSQGYAKIAEYCVSLGYKVVLCGGPGPLDQALASQITQINDAIALNLVAKTSLKQMLAVLAQASLVIAPDTGPAHMATMVDTPVVGLYAHSNPLRTGPYLSRHTTVSVYDKCIQQQKGKPWQELAWGVRAKGDNLMSDISVNSVIKQISNVLPTIHS